MTAVAPITTTGTWQIDSAHSTAQFAVRHMMVATVKGSFNEVAGMATANDDGTVDVDVTIPVATIDTRNAQRDAHLRSPDFFDAESYPTIAFKGKRLEGDMDRNFRLIGDLTMRGITREIVLNVTREGAGPDPYGNERMGFSATAKVNRQDFGLRWNAALETGGVVVGDEVRISIDVELVRPLT